MFSTITEISPTAKSDSFKYCQIKVMKLFLKTIELLKWKRIAFKAERFPELKIVDENEISKAHSPIIS
jgi:hypothetical protein